MTPDDIILVRQILPETVVFPYFAGRDAAWLLSRGLQGPTKVRGLRTTCFGRLLDRPIIKPIVAASADGVIHPDAIQSLGAADMTSAAGSRAGLAGVEVALSERWFDFQLNFDAWGHDHNDWAWSQLSRKGGNLVLQLGFPGDHARQLGKTVNRNLRKECEYYWHPVRETGCPTLAWVRLDIDLETGEALIEEVQSDWLRKLAYRVVRLRKTAPRSRDLKAIERYQREIQTAYARVWPRAALLAALHVVVDEIGCNTIWMHMPKSGAVLKHIEGTHPPRSLYTDLPKAFCFEATESAPSFLLRRRRRHLAHLRKEGPIFWKLVL